MPAIASCKSAGTHLAEPIAITFIVDYRRLAARSAECPASDATSLGQD